MDYYKILNLKIDASLKEIEQAYLDLSSFYNPKNNVTSSSYKKFREINKAYLVLKEEKQRELYKLTLNKENKEVIKEDSTSFKLEDFNVKRNQENKDILMYKDVIVSDKYSNYDTYNFEVPYLYYLCNSEYKVSYLKKEIISIKDTCKECLGIGKVKKDNKIVYCKNCLSTGKEVVIKNVKVDGYLLAQNKIIDEDKVIIEFEYLNKEEYEVEDNKIYYKHVVSEYEFYNGIRYELKKGDNKLIIEEKDFKELNKTYIFDDKIIKIEYLLKEYSKQKIKGYIITDKKVIYVNPVSFVYSFTPSDTCTYKLELNEKIVEFELSNKVIELEVIRVKNEDQLTIFFDKKIKKVSSKLFKLRGYYNNHYFKKNKNFDYDENYIYLPSRAYKLQTKHYTLFKILYISLYLLIPIILFLIFGISYIFFILSFIVLVLYLIGVNWAMEVKL